MKGNVLIVEDEKSIADILRYQLLKEGLTVECAYDGDRALKMVEEIVPDLIILDVMLPLRDGMEVCREVRKKYDMPIIMLSARESEIDKVIGLEMGADDYMTKPFSTRELLARVKANLRRYWNKGQKREGSSMSIGPLVINSDSFTVSKEGREIKLTRREFELLHYLVQHSNQVITREQLLETVWGYEYYGDARTVDVTVRRLREKIEDNPSHPDLIQTRRGVGYYFIKDKQD